MQAKCRQAHRQAGKYTSSDAGRRQVQASNKQRCKQQAYFMVQVDVRIFVFWNINSTQCPQYSLPKRIKAMAIHFRNPT